MAASGCVQNSSTNLNPDFGLDYVSESVNESGYSIYQDAVSRNVSAYSVEADNKMAMNLPIVSISVNMTSDGVFQDESFEINSSGVMGINLGENSNSTRFNTRITSSEDGAEVEKEIMGEENQTSEQYSRSDLGISREALESLNVRDASVLGVSNLSGEENLLLNLTVDESNLMSNSERIFEVHSPVQESTDEGGDMSEVGSFNQSEAYIWVDREDRTVSKFAYYGSAQNGSLQIRSVSEYSER